MKLRLKSIYTIVKTEADDQIAVWILNFAVVRRNESVKAKWFFAVASIFEKNQRITRC